ncbi:MAG TPA: MBL fold metallo-hydrolase, partial [Myxococcaceae bacterium]|nr:MBL fold metallo-hydrolase [Myxococcaceae bacterium]
AQGQDFSKVEVKASRVAGSVYMLEGAGGNIGVSVGEDGILIVDDQFAPLAPKIQAALKSIAPQPVKFVLNTHWHGDHTGGNAAFAASASIIAHENVRKRLGAESRSFDGQIRPPAPPAALPVITFDDRLTVHVNGEDIRAIHFPKGHTDGDAIIFFSKSNVVHMGDDFFSGRFPFIDLQSGGSVKGLIANLDKVIPQIPSGAKIIPGHGPLSTIDELKKFASMLRESTALVEAGIRGGKTLDQMKKEKVLGKFDSWSWEFIKTERFTEILYNDLTAKVSRAE